MDSVSSPADPRWLAWARGTVTNFPAEKTLPQIFGEWAAKSPDAPAILEGERIVTYGELDAWSSELAEDFRRGGVLPGARVGVPAVRSAPFVAAILGILKAGGAYLPLDEDEPAARQALRLLDCHQVLRWRDARAAELLAGGASPGEPVPSSSEAPAYVLYTSGSTGKPKGVVVPHRAITRLVCQTDYLDVRPSDRFALHSNLSFDASTLEIWGPLLNGGSLVVTPRETVLSAETLGAHLRRYGATSLWLTTTLFSQLAEQAPSLFGGLRHVFFGGEAANPTAVQRVWEHGRPGALINGYGPTETTTFAVCHRVDGSEGERIPIGRPIANTDAWVLNAAGEPAAEGELWIGGPGMALGYLGEPELTAQRFVQTSRGRLYRTGDRAAWREDGTLDFLGRTDRQIKIRGFRIEPGEVEVAIGRFPGVRQCAVRVQGGGAGESILSAFVVGGVALGELRSFLHAELPAQMVPVAYAALEALPLTANGKLDESALPRAEVLHDTTEPPSLRATTQLEQEIAAAWQRVLKQETIGLDENFFDLGGTSLSIIRLHAELRRLPAAGGLRLVTLFQHPTVRGLAANLAGGSPLTPALRASERAARRRASASARGHA